MIKNTKVLKSKKKKKILLIIFTAFLLLILSLILFHFINNIISKKQVERLRKNIEEISSYKTSYVIIEINPKILIELTGDKVTNKICLNSDCENVFGNLILNNMKLKETINTLYETAKTKGIDTSNGVKLSTTDTNLQKVTEGLDCVTYNILTTEEENSILNELENKEEIEKKKNEYNKKLLDIYKTDSDYGKYYTCKEGENNIKCYITSNFENDLSEVFNITNLNNIINNVRNLNRILDKFNVEYHYNNSYGVKDIYEISANGKYLWLGNDLSYTGENKVHYNFPYLEIDENLLPLIKLNLVDSTYDNKDLIQMGNEYKK